MQFIFYSSLQPRLWFEKINNTADFIWDFFGGEFQGIGRIILASHVSRTESSERHLVPHSLFFSSFMKDTEGDAQTAGSLDSLAQSPIWENFCFCLQGCDLLLTIACLKANLCTCFNYMHPATLLSECTDGRKAVSACKELLFVLLFLETQFLFIAFCA